MATVDTLVGKIGFTEKRLHDETPIIFLHGVGSDKSVWRPQIEHFGQESWGRAIALDYPGYGESELRAAKTRDDFAVAILSAMDSLAIERAHICGLSLGGVIAIAMHAIAPGRCASLIVADSFAVHPDGRAIYDRSITASQGGMRALAEARVGALLASDDADLKNDVIDTMSRIEPASYRIGAEAVWLADQVGRAASIGVPTLMICGELDPITPPSLSKELVQIIPDSRLEVIPGASHLANLDRPAEFNRAIDDFLSGIDHYA